LGTETNQVLQALNQSIAAEPSISLPQQFSEEYPKTGVSYEVRSGDTLSGIARAQGSKIKWIQNANKIANPARDLQVGQTIFIPLKK
jgi:LysM repeat protein